MALNWPLQLVRPVQVFILKARRPLKLWAGLRGYFTRLSSCTGQSIPSCLSLVYHAHHFLAMWGCCRPQQSPVTSNQYSGLLISTGPYRTLPPVENTLSQQDDRSHMQCWEQCPVAQWCTGQDCHLWLFGRTSPFHSFPFDMWLVRGTPASTAKLMGIFETQHPSDCLRSLGQTGHWSLQY